MGLAIGCASGICQRADVRSSILIFFCGNGARSFWMDHIQHGSWLSITVLCALADSWAEGGIVHLDSQ